MKKGCLIFGLIGGVGFLACGGFFFLLFGGIYMLTAEMTGSANEFLDSAGRQDFTASYGYMCNDYQNRNSADDLETFIRNNSLDEFESAFWNMRSIENDTGRLEGSVTTKSGQSIPVTMELRKEDGEWKIVAIKETPFPLQPAAAEPPPAEVVPPEG